MPAEREGGYFTAAQADRGRDLYTSDCASCHGRALDDGTAPALAPEQYFDVLAYMLQRNGYSAADRALMADAADLTAVTIESREAAGSNAQSAMAFILTGDLVAFNAETGDAGLA